jgi:2-polyprenyl-3-methyl-5-hydroxy-6-metoxy-1,4-benzoquinol methylase
VKLKNRYRQLKPFIRGNSYCDIGCGGGDLVAYLLDTHDEFHIAAGIDIMDWRTEKVKQKIDFQMLDFSRSNTTSKKQYDTLTCLAVLHHTGNQKETMIRFLKNVQTAMKPGGRLIIEEDVIIPVRDQSLNRNIKSQLELLNTQQKFLSDFLQFDQDKQKNIIISIDFLANCLAVGVPEMPFPCGFQTLGDWISIFDNTTLKLIEVRIQGFVKNNFNQSCHVFFILEN